MKCIFCVLAGWCCLQAVFSCGSSGPVEQVFSGNPVLPGWYADPEVIMYGDRYWIYPTYSDAFDLQIFMDAFSSPDLVNWTGPGYRVAYAISDNPFGPFRKEGVILQQDETVARGAGHHSVLKIPGEDAHYMVYHRRPLDETDPNHRVTCIDRMEFGPDGKILPVTLTHEGVKSHPIQP